MDARTRVNLLLDRYGALLPKAQHDAVRMVYGEDLSLAEIAEGKGVTRQAAHWAVRSGVARLERCEQAVRALEQTAAWRGGIVKAMRETQPDDVRGTLAALLEDMEDRYGV